MSTFYLFVNGINAKAEGNITEWQFRAERWVDQQTPDDADSYAYHVGWWERWLHQKTHIENVAALINERHLYRFTEKLVVVGHSNGCAVVCGALERIAPGLEVAELHLIAGAVSGDYDANGINAAVRLGKVKRVAWYTSANDEALKVAKWSKRLLGWLGLGYESGGIDGPSNMTEAAAQRTVEIRDDSMGHSTYFDADHFEKTMRSITGTEELPEY